MEIYKIEKNIPCPMGGKLRDTISQLEVGDSFAFKPDTLVKGRNLAFMTAKRAGIKVSIRKISDELLRVWRIS